MPDPAVTLHFTHRFGALDRIVSLLRRRGFPVAGLTVERTHQQDVGRMTVVVEEPAATAQVARHLSKLPDVLQVHTSGELNAVRREYTLARIHCTPAQRPEVMALLEAFGARAISVTSEHLVVEATGQGQELDALYAELGRYGIEESARTNPIVMRRQNGEDL